MHSTGNPSHRDPIVVLGDIMVDILLRPRGTIRPASDTVSHISLAVGGTGTNTATHLARLGVPARLIGRVGSDLLGRLALEHLRAEGIDAGIEQFARPQDVDATDTATGAIGILIDAEGQRTMLTQRGINVRLDVDFVRGRWPARPRALFLSGYTLFRPETRAAARFAMDKARRAGVPVALDPASYAMIADMGVDEFLALAAGATVLLPNRQEAAVLVGFSHRAADGASVDEVETLLAPLARSFPVVVMTADKDGCYARAGDETHHVAAQPVTVVDTTGAGDGFNAAFLAAYTAGEPLVAALRAGNELASRIVQQMGAT